MTNSFVYFLTSFFKILFCILIQYPPSWSLAWNNFMLRQTNVSIQTLFHPQNGNRKRSPHASNYKSRQQIFNLLCSFNKEICWLNRSLFNILMGKDPCILALFQPLSFEPSQKVSATLLSWNGCPHILSFFSLLGLFEGAFCCAAISIQFVVKHSWVEVIDAPLSFWLNLKFNLANLSVCAYH